MAAKYLPPHSTLMASLCQERGNRIFVGVRSYVRRTMIGLRATITRCSQNLTFRMIKQRPPSISTWRQRGAVSCKLLLVDFENVHRVDLAHLGCDLPCHYLRA